MTLEKLLYRIGEMGIRNKVINYSAAGSSIYEINANTIKSYPILFSSPTGNHKITDNMSEYEITLYYIDRLLNDSGNDIQIFSTAIEQLKYIIRNIDNMSDVLEVSEEYEIVNFTETEALNDRTAGAYTTIRINTKNQNDCYDEDIFTGPIRLQEKSIDITENGHYQVVYDKIYDGISEVDINVNVDVEDYYERGYEQGKTDGYDEGYAVGEQVSYGAGYEQGQVDAAANARVLNVTENGSYLSKFSDPIIPTLVTGIYDDGTEFFSYVKLNNAIYNTKITASQDSRIEFWYKGDNNSVGDSFNVIIGAGNDDNDNVYQIRYNYLDNSTLLFQIGITTVRINNWDDTVWHHIVVSLSEGVWIDGEKKGDFSTTIAINGEFYINGVEYAKTRNANGTFGMIKIDDVVIIPTADGFLNVNTGELLEIIQDGIYAYTENLPKYGEGELFKTINVDVVPKINIQEAGVKLQNSTFTEIPKWVDLEGITDMDGMFSGCKNLTELPILNVPYCLNFSGVFSEVPFTDLTNIQYWVYPNNANWNVAFQQNTKIERCSAIYMEGNDTYYQGYPFWVYSDLTDFTDFGGFIGLKYSITREYALPKLPNLSYESCMNIINGLYDFNGNGETPNNNQGQLKVHPNFITLVGEEGLAMATAKGWTITS